LLYRNWKNLGQGIRRGLVREDDQLCPAEGYSLSCRQTRRVDRLRVLANGNFAAVIPGDSVAETVITSGISSTLSLYQSALVVRVLLTWFPNPPAFIAQPLQTICDPYLNLFRGLIPPIGGTIDLSPILAFVVLDLASGSASSLSAEMPDKKALKGSKKD
jgi:YggT family protein